MDPPLVPAPEPDLGLSRHMDQDPALFFLVSWNLSGAGHAPDTDCLLLGSVIRGSSNF